MDALAMDNRHVMMVSYMGELLSFKERRRKESAKLTTASFVRSCWQWVLRSLNLPCMVSTCLGFGKIPLLCGTVGALCAYPIYYVALLHSSSFSQLSVHLLLVCMGLTLLAMWAIPLYTAQVMVKDHKSIIVDEIIGQLLTISMSANAIAVIVNYLGGAVEMQVHNFIFVLSFFLFRFFDIYKPLGIGFIDAHIKSAIGVVLDDVLAAVYSAVVAIIIAKVMVMTM